MQLLKHLPTVDISQRLARGELHLHIGPYTYNLQSNVATIAAGIQTLYGDFPVADPREFTDYGVAMQHCGLLGRLRGQAEFLFDEQSPFGAIPARQAYAFLEWGMNWCVSIYNNEYLKLHAAVVAKNGAAIIMPGIPGAGKSTLCAALGLTGWRVLSDEHALIIPGTLQLAPLYRPVSLKNESIDVIKSFCSSAIFGPASTETHKGVVAHMKGDLAPDSHDKRTLPARIMMFPKYTKDEPQRLSPRGRTGSFILTAYHSFNYSLLGETGFQAMKKLMENVECYDLVYHDLDWALQAVSDLHDRHCA